MSKRSPFLSLLIRLAVISALVITAITGYRTAFAQPAGTAVEPVVGGLDFPSAFAFAPDGRIYVVERGRAVVSIVEDGRRIPQPLVRINTVTQAETGLLGIALDPAFTSEPWVYLYHTYRGPGGQIFNRVVRLRDEGGRAGSQEVLIDRIPAAAIHNGGKLAFGPDEKLYVTTGDATEREKAQDRQALNGKLLRLNSDGSIPDDNPTRGSPVYSMGHRNVFGLAFHPLGGGLYITENGPNRDDEINLIRAGANYGWPRVTGVARTSRFTDPLATYTPNIAPTGIAFPTSERLPERIRTGLVFGNWNRGELRLVELKTPGLDSIIRQEILYRAPGSGILDLQTGPDGELYFSTRSGVFRFAGTAAPASDDPTTSAPSTAAPRTATEEPTQDEPTPADGLPPWAFLLAAGLGALATWGILLLLRRRGGS